MVALKREAVRGRPRAAANQVREVTAGETVTLFGVLYRVVEVGVAQTENGRCGFCRLERVK